MPTLTKSADNNAVAAESDAYAEAENEEDAAAARRREGVNR